MAEFTLNEIAGALQGCCILKEKGTLFTSVVTDTRQIKAGSLFVALRGEKFDGHDFLTEAVLRGAAGALVSRPYSGEELAGLDFTVVRSDDTLAAYQRLAGAHRARFKIPVLAVTGSNGKTTTKDLTAAVLSGRWNVLKTEANYNNEIGLPLTLLQLDGTHGAAVVEMGMRGFGQIAQLADIARPDMGLVTNVGETHMELLGSLENIAAAKSELVERIPEMGTVILNDDNPYVKAMAVKARGRVVTFGMTERADVRASQVESGRLGASFVCSAQGQSFRVQLPMPGRHNVYNALAAIAAGVSLGLAPEEVQAGLGRLQATKMRLEVEKIKQYTVINDAYNASPASMRAAIETLSEFAPGRKVAVLGDMLELGGLAEKAHEEVGRQLAAQKVDMVITIGKLGEIIAGSAKSCGVPEVFACASHEEAARAFAGRLTAGDTILVKGSRGMQMEKVIAFI